MSDLSNLDLKIYSIPQLEEHAERVTRAIAERREAVEKELRGVVEREGLAYEIVKKKGGYRIAGRQQPKFRNPQNPKQTWSGRGKRPRWVVEALGQGTTLEELAIA